MQNNNPFNQQDGHFTQPIVPSPYSFTPRTGSKNHMPDSPLLDMGVEQQVSVPMTPDPVRNSVPSTPSNMQGPSTPYSHMSQNSGPSGSRSLESLHTQQDRESLTSTSNSNTINNNPPSIQPPLSVISSIPVRTPMSTAVPTEMPTLQNIVSTVNLGIELDLKNIALKARNAEYNPKRFAAVIMRIRNPRTTALIFRTGKMVCTGAKSIEYSRHAARKFARIIQKLDYPDAKFLEFKVQNMVGSVDVKFPIRLEGLVISHAAFSHYEPELFPGLIYRMVKPKIVLLIFVSGKVVLTGAKDEKEIRQAFEIIYPVLKAYKKGSNALMKIGS